MYNTSVRKELVSLFLQNIIMMIRSIHTVVITMVLKIMQFTESRTKMSILMNVLHLEIRNQR